MTKRLFQTGVILASLLSMFCTATITDDIQVETTLVSVEKPYTGVISAQIPIISEIPVIEPHEVTEVALERDNLPLEATLAYNWYRASDIDEETFFDDLELLGLICLAEAENQSELGKRLVIDTVLNRMYSGCWDDWTIREVIEHPGQYESYWNGRIDRVEMNEEIAQLVMEELYNLTNDEVIYFKTGGYHNPSKAIIQEGDHYFCGQ